MVGVLEVKNCLFRSFSGCGVGPYSGILGPCAFRGWQPHTVVEATSVEDTNFYRMKAIR